MRYDTSNRITTMIAYAKRISATVSDNFDALSIRDRLNNNGADAKDRKTVQAFDANNRLVYTIDANNGTTELQYDALGQVIKTIRYANPLPSTTALTFTAIGTALQPFAANTSNQTTEHEYDRAGRIIKATDAMGFVETFTYDALNHRTGFTDKTRSNTWNYEYDAAGRMTRELAPSINITTSSRNADGTLATTQINAVRLITQMTYDALGNVLSRTEASGRPEARTTRYEYDSLGRLRVTYLPTVGVYDAAADNLTQDTGIAPRTEQNKNLYSVNEYNTFGDLITQTDVAGSFTRYTYDNLSRLIATTDALGGVTTHDYNTFGEETALTRVGDASNPTRTLRTSYNNLGQVTEITEPQT